MHSATCPAPSAWLSCATRTCTTTSRRCEHETRLASASGAESGDFAKSAARSPSQAWAVSADSREKPRRRTDGYRLSAEPWRPASASRLRVSRSRLSTTAPKLGEIAVVHYRDRPTARERRFPCHVDRARSRSSRRRSEEHRSLGDRMTDPAMADPCETSTPNRLNPPPVRSTQARAGCWIRFFSPQSDAELDQAARPHLRNQRPILWSIRRRF